MNYISIVKTSFLILALQHLQASAQPQKAEADILNMMRENPVAGLSVAVVKKGRIVYSNAFGYRDMDSSLPLQKENLFRIASISKSFTATCLMQLVEREIISLDDDVSSLIGIHVRNPRYPETKITLRMLLSHQSSINDSQGYFSVDAIDTLKNRDWQKAYNNYAPGMGYMYCNLNYNLAGAILEKLTNTRFDIYVKQQIFTPLHIMGGYCVDSLDVKNLAKIYSYNTDSSKFIYAPAAYAPRREEIAHYVIGRSAPIFSPTGGVKISATGLATYMMMHSHLGKLGHQRILKKRSAKTMQTIMAPKEKYGLGLYESDKLIKGINMRGHSGSAYGLYSAMFWEPKKKWGFVVISNGCHPAQTDGFNTIISRTVDILYQNFIQ